MPTPAEPAPWTPPAPTPSRRGRPPDALSETLRNVILADLEKGVPSRQVATKLGLSKDRVQRIWREAKENPGPDTPPPPSTFDDLVSEMSSRATAWFRFKKAIREAEALRTSAEARIVEIGRALAGLDFDAALPEMAKATESRKEALETLRSTGRLLTETQARILEIGKALAAFSS